MTEPEQDRYLSKTERRYFDALATYDTMKLAAEKLGIKAGTLYNWKLSLKKRYRRKRGWINAVLAQTKRGGLKAFLTEKKPLAGADEEEEEEEAKWK